MERFQLTLLVVLVTACDAHTSTWRITSHVPSDPAGFSNALYQSTRVTLKPGHRVELVNNGAVFDRLEQSFAKAERSINIVLFIWRPGLVSERLERAIAARTKRGVTCRVLVDPLPSEDFGVTVKPRLAASGCEVRMFRPLRRGASIERNHRKIVVIDGELGVTGGFGVDDSWLGDGKKPDEWRESNVVVEGPAVNELQQAFADNWQEAGGALLPATDFPAASEKGPTLAGFVSSTASDHLTRAERLMQLLIASATTRVWIANAYFVPSEGLIDLLVEKRKQGVDVRVMAAGDQTDMPTVLAEQRATYKALRAGGVRLWEYQPSVLHSKTMLVDDHLSVVGSINLDWLSMVVLEEGSLVMSDPRVVAALVTAWDADVALCVEVP
ncbi:MAG: phosphatidylserine/phosphatidylglycerophosphate/cardiolipin synthase family protein [Myxococcales bacterium]|nr:phosphatidylserine/phosphatidylglycerophosphate/cardiolipin synthase family protein [Myxococcales bacterium]